MSDKRIAKIREILDVCEKINEPDLNFILGYASGIAVKESIKRRK